MIRVGIDEAGYGPLIGPLVIGAAAFRVPDETADLRQRLRGIVRRATGALPRKGGLPFPVDDSKLVNARFGLPGLARGVCGCVAAAGHEPPADLRDWLERFADRGPSSFATDPWFVEPEREAVPAAPPPKGLRERVLLRGVEPLGVEVSPVSARELNEAIVATGNKARVLFLASSALLMRVLERWPAEDVTAVLDREGGRLDYGEYLADVFPFRPIEREPSPPGVSRYAFRDAGRTVRLVFATGGDRVDLATGLASMAAKMTRELFMGRLNAWFLARQPTLKPTAGYVEDGRRFLADAASVLERECVDLRHFVRER